MRRAPIAAILILLALMYPAAAQTARPCPEGVPAGVHCYADLQPNGAQVLAAVPRNWNGVLVVHAHGGPRTFRADAATNDEDLGRLSVFVRDGNAWVASSYRRPGYGVTMAAEDTDAARRYFLRHIAPLHRAPRLIILHGQSWGGNIAGKLLEMDARRTPHAYDAGFLTSAVLPGGPQTYWFRADLRAVYQYYCRNMPRPDEPQYVVATGLPPGSSLTDKDIRDRVDDCTGIAHAASDRSPAQAAALANILNVIGIQEGSLMTHMFWSTFVFRDMVQNRLGGANPFSNIGVVYKGSTDDAALNAGVARFASDRAGRRALDHDSRLSGAIAVPVLTLHAINDPTAPVENEAAYRERVESAGAADHLVQIFVDETAHSRLSAPQYAAGLDTIREWLETGHKPTAETIAARCQADAKQLGEPCLIRPDYTPRPYAARVPDRHP